jgi:anti-sigma regulatory factor (Ser/Thr protein kinase)
LADGPLKSATISGSAFPGGGKRLTLDHGRNINGGAWRMTASNGVNHAKRLQVLIPADANQLASLRQVQREWAASTGLDDQTQEILLLAVQEAAANAVEHAYWSAVTPGVVEVSFWLDTDAVNVRVVDSGTWRPPTTESPFRGFGLTMMRSLVDFVSIDPGPTGTTVFLRHGLSASVGSSHGP